MSNRTPTEPIIEPDLPIVDPHHHLWFVPKAALKAMTELDQGGGDLLAKIFVRHPRYLFDELLADVESGHNVRATVFVEVHAMYRASGPETMRSVGEVEFANGMGAMAASGVFGDVKLCAGIVGGVDFRWGDAVKDVLTTHIQAGGGRYRGVRAFEVGYDKNLDVLGSAPHLLLDVTFRAGFKHLEPLGLSYDAWVLEPQLPELIDLARTFPQTRIILNHVGSPIRIGSYSSRHDGRFSIWRDNIRALSQCANVAVKLGGLGNPLCGFPSSALTTPAGSEVLAEEWRPYIETCIESFGVHRCMFESNFPVDAVTASYPVIWNAFKRIVSGASKDEKTALFSGTAIRLYRLDL